jgi:hypothetical protein
MMGGLVDILNRAALMGGSTGDETMNTFTIDDIRKFWPCYDPNKYLPEDWEGTALDILRVDTCPAKNRFWVVLRDGWIDDKTLRLFAVWCAREVLKLVDNPDPRSIAACDVAERYANGAATQQELAAARAAARAAAWDADRAAAWDATAARAAARAAAGAATGAAAWDATGAWDAAGAAAWDAQLKHLIEMLEENG